MSNLIINNETFRDIIYTHESLVNGDYESCSFINCDFQKLNLSNINFIECTFENCNLSSTQLNNTGLKTVLFKKCKLLGMSFTDVNPFLLALQFEACMLNLSSFHKHKLKGTKFINCSLHEVDFEACDLSAAQFDHSDLREATFNKTNLEKADFRLAINYSIDPERNAMKKAKFSSSGIHGLLNKYNIVIE